MPLVWTGLYVTFKSFKILFCTCLIDLYMHYGALISNIVGHILDGVEWMMGRSSTFSEEWCLSSITSNLIRFANFRIWVMSCHTHLSPITTKFTKTKIWRNGLNFWRNYSLSTKGKLAIKGIQERVFKKQQIRKIKNKKRKRNFRFPALTDWHKCPFGYQWSPTDSLNNGVGLIFEKEKS